VTTYGGLSLLTATTLPVEKYLGRGGRLSLIASADSRNCAVNEKLLASLVWQSKPERLSRILNLIAGRVGILRPGSRGRLPQSARLVAWSESLSSNGYRSLWGSFIVEPWFAKGAYSPSPAIAMAVASIYAEGLNLRDDYLTMVCNALTIQRREVSFKNFLTPDRAFRIYHTPEFLAEFVLPRVKPNAT